jgi:subtilisin family serine protease
MHHKNNNLLFLLTLLITACGGGSGGGGGSNTPPPSPAPTISFTASPVSVLLNSTSTFSWSTTNATSCTASGSTQWSGSKATSGTEDIPITIPGNTTFTLSCSGAGGSRNASVIIEGFRQTDGVVVDGYISGANVFIDENENFIADAQENATTSDNDGKFTIKYANGSLVSIGGTDLDSQTLLDNLLITHKLDGFSDFKAITPITSVDAFLESTDINVALGIDSSINIAVDDPVALKGDGGIYDYLYEKGNQLTVLAYALQNITNDLNTTTETTQDFFKSIAEEVETEYAETQSKVDIETTDFISKVLTNVETAKTLNLNETDKSNTVTALASVIPIIQVKEDADTTTSLIRFGVSQLQEDIVSLANGSASEELVEDYTQDVINYIATTESISSDNLTPDISSIDDSVVLDEDSVIDIFILNNDSFVAGAPFSISTTLPMNGNVEIINNYITYTPDTDYFGDDDLSYTLSQGDKTSSADVNITINSINDAPSIDIASTLTASENQTAITTISISDVDEDELTLTLGGTDASSLNLSAENVLSFKEAPDYETKDNYSINLSLTDGTETTDKDISILVTDINDVAPVFTSSASFNAPENQLAIGTVTANDEEDDDLSFSISSEELVITSEGVLTFVSAPDFEAKSSYTTTITVSDGINEATQDISVNVTNVNDVAPVFTSSATFSAAENQTAINTVTATDADGDDVTFTVSGSEFAITSTGVLTFASAPDYETKSSYTATVTAADGTNSTTQDITVNVTDVNDVPVFTSGSIFSAAENQTAIGTVTATDDEGEGVTFTVSGSELAITLAGVLTFASAPDYETKSSYTATVTASDDTNSTSQEITVNITDVNEVPVFTSSATFNAAENQTAIDTVTATDPDGDSVTFTVSGSELAITTAGVLTFVSAPDFETKKLYKATVTASDGTNTADQTIKVQVTDANENSPSFTSEATFSAAENQTAIGTVAATDADGDSVTFTVSGSELAITSAGVLTFASAPDYETKSSYTATVTASDGTNSTTQSITVNVTNVIEVPVFTSSATFSAAENQTSIGTVTATDSDGDSVTFTVSGSELEITSAGVLSFVSAPDYETKSTYTATVTASDGTNTSTQDITVNVTDVDENVDTGPVFTSDSTFEVAENQLVIGEVTATDPDGDSISFSTTSTEILIDSLNGNMTFVSSPNFEAKSVYTATILASDGVNESTQDITINITNVVEAPEAFDKTIIFRVLPQIQTEQNITLPADGDNLTYIIVSNPSKGTLTLNGNIATYKAFLNYTTSDTDSFTFKVSNGSEESSVATLSIDIMTDPLYKYQWHLENTGQTTFATNPGIADEDLNLNTVISSGYTGAGVTVAVIDSGLEIGHEDLADNMVAGSYDFLDSDTDPTNTIDVSGDHGTSVAGIIAARGWNGLGGRGVAPDASLIGYNLLQNGFGSYQLQSWGINPPVEANVDIYNMSYGNYYPGISQTFALPDFLDAYYEDALVTATTELRSGKGALYVQSSGNEYSDYATADCGENEFTCVEVIWDNWSTVPYILQVGALNANGQKSSYTTTGAALWVSGFGGETGANESILSNQNLQLPSGIYEPAILTTDQSSCSKGYVSTNVSTRYNEFENSTGNKAINSECNYTSTFGGTSSAAPTVAGVMALIISANPELTWRDVKHIIASTSDQVGTDSDYTYDFQGINQYEWETNSAGYKFHNWFGFGKINAADAVDMALSMQGNNLGTFQTTGFQQEVQDELVISDTETTSATIEITKPENSNNSIEFVRVSIQFNHLVPKSIGLRLVSPDGTEVNIMQPMTNLGTNPANTLFDIGVSGLYGESIEGTWTLYADDYIEDAIEGSLIQWGIEIYGN